MSKPGKPLTIGMCVLGTELPLEWFRSSHHLLLEIFKLLKYLWYDFQEIDIITHNGNSQFKNDLTLNPFVVCLLPFMISSKNLNIFICFSIYHTFLF